MTKGQWQSYQFEALLRKIQQASTIQSLQLYAEEAKTAADHDKPKLREAYAKRLRELTPKPDPD